MLACCLMVPNQYLNQCWLVFGEVCAIHLRAISQKVPKVLYSIVSLKIILLRLLANILCQWVKSLTFDDIWKYCLQNVSHIVQAWSHWGRVMHICTSNLTIIGSDNGLWPDRHQAIIWTNARILLIQTLETNFSEILSKIHTSSFKKMHLQVLSVK